MRIIPPALLIPALLAAATPVRATDPAGETPDIPYPLSLKGYPASGEGSKIFKNEPKMVKDRPDISKNVPKPSGGDGDPALSAAIRRFLRDNPAAVAEALERYRADRERAAEAARDAAVGPFLKAAARDGPGPGLGSADAPATIYAFVDYRCRYCKREDKVLRTLAAERPGVRVAFVEYPILGGASVYAARAVLAAAEQGKYQSLHRALMDHKGALTAAAVDALASALGIDVAAMKAAMTGAAIAERIAGNKAAAARLGFFGTPSFVIGGRRRSGFLDAATIKALLAAGRRDAAEPPPWAENTIAAWDADGFRRAAPFVEKLFWTSSDALDVFAIVGTEHPDYAGLSWLDFLRTGKRMAQNLELYESNPGYYDGTDQKQPAMIYKSLDGVHWHVAGDGNHRSCIARFAFHDAGKRILRGLTTTRYVIDRDYLALFAALQAAARNRGDVHVEASPRKRGRDDGPGWMIETFDTAVLIDDGLKRRTLDRDDLARETARLATGKSLFKRLAERLSGL